MTRAQPSVRVAGRLPRWSSVLAVVAHPDDESFGLGAILDSFTRTGSTVSVLCLTPGDASTLGPVGDLGALRAKELQAAATVLGVDRAILTDYPDGALATVDPDMLNHEVLDRIRETKADGLLVFDPSGVSGHSDHSAATSAALAAADCLDLPVLGWTIPRLVAERLNDKFWTTFTGHDPRDIDLVVPVDREQQRVASLAHASQAVPTSVLWYRLDLLGDEENLRWLRRPKSTAARRTADNTVRVEHRTGDRFRIQIRDHTLAVDQPIDAGGDDTAPTPTELFIASLASCVAFYARRYLHRHHLDSTGLTVSASYRLATKPARVDQVVITVRLAGLPPERRDALLAVVQHCTVHNSITTTPDISIDVRTSAEDS